MPTAPSNLGRGSAVAPCLADDRVIPAGRDTIFIAGLGLVEQFAAEWDFVDPHWSRWVVGREEEVWDVLLERHCYCGGVVVVGVGGNGWLFSRCLLGLNCILSCLGLFD